MTSFPMPTPENNPQTPAPDASKAWKAPQMPASYEQDLDKGLHGIYDAERDAPKEDMSRLEQADHSTAKRVLVGMMAFFAMLAAVSWAGFFFFAPGKARFEGDKVKVDIEGPAQVKSGDLVTYAVHYTNGHDIALGTASLELRLPKELRVTKTDPAVVEGSPSTWQIGSIAPGKDGLVSVEGVALAPLAKDMDIQAILTYRPADFNSEFQKVTTRTVTVTDSALELAASGPTKVLPGDKVVLKLDYHNASAQAIENVHLRGAWPDAFIPESSVPKMIDGIPNEWNVGTLKPDAKGTVTVTGSFASAAEGAQDVGGQIGYADKDAVFQLQRETKYVATVLKGDLVSALILNGKATDQPIRFGDKLRYSVTYKNTGTASLEDVSLAVHIEPSAQGKLVKWAELNDKAAGTLSGNVLTWTKKQIPSLAKIGAGEEGTLNFDLPFIDAPLPGAKDPVYVLTSWLEAHVTTIDGDKADRTAKTQPMVAKALSDTALSSTARYFDQDNVPVGTGPLPPETGKPTT
ncbi:MAG: hypothetical protein RLZZ324_1060, partial [Candidatus Parcubacteria bacterium]